MKTGDIVNIQISNFLRSGSTLTPVIIYSIFENSFIGRYKIPEISENLVSSRFKYTDIE